MLAQDMTHLLLAQGWTASGTAGALERTHTPSDDGRRPSGRVDPQPLSSSRPGVTPALGETQQAELRVPVHPELQAALIAATSYGAVGSGP